MSARSSQALCFAHVRYLYLTSDCNALDWDGSHKIDPEQETATCISKQKSFH
jgi:hypothetical protein